MLVSQVRVAHGSLDILVPHQQTGRKNVNTAHHQPRGEGVPQIVPVKIYEQNDDGVEIYPWAKVARSVMKLARFGGRIKWEALAGFCPRWFALTLVLTMLAAPTDATSIIINVKTDRILVIADSRAVLQNPNGKEVRDDKCKIVVFGARIAFAETGREGYTRSSPADNVPEWHGTSEALKAYSEILDHDLYNVALRWSIQVTNNFQLFYLSDPQRVRSLAIPQGILLSGIFAGKDSGGVLRAYVARTALDDTLREREGAPIPIGHALDEIPPKEKPYSTNAVTQELLDGKTDRAKGMVKLWAKRSHRIPRADRELRWLEFVVEQTGDYDSEVHGPTNAVEVTRESVTWLQNKTCQAPGD